MDELLDVMKAGLSLGVLHSVAHDVLADKKKRMSLPMKVQGAQTDDMFDLTTRLTSPHV